MCSESNNSEDYQESDLSAIHITIVSSLDSFYYPASNRLCHYSLRYWAYLRGCFSPHLARLLFVRFLVLFLFHYRSLPLPFLHHLLS